MNPSIHTENVYKTLFCHLSLLHKANTASPYKSNYVPREHLVFFSFSLSLSLSLSFSSSLSVSLSLAVPLSPFPFVDVLCDGERRREGYLLRLNVATNIWIMENMFMVTTCTTDTTAVAVHQTTEYAVYRGKHRLGRSRNSSASLGLLIVFDQMHLQMLRYSLYSLFF